MIRYHVKKGTETFKKLDEMRLKAEEISGQARKLVKKLGGAKEYAIGSRAIYGGISGIELPEKPEGWKLAWPGQSSKLFFPKSTKANKALLDEIYALPRIEEEEFNKTIGFKRQMVGLTMCRHFGFSYHDTFYIVNISEVATYKPKNDMREITHSEFMKLTKSAKKDLRVKKEDVLFI